MAVPRIQGPPLPEHPLRDQQKLTVRQLKTLLDKLPPPADQYLLGRQLTPLEDDPTDTDSRPLEIRLKPRFLYEDGISVCYHLLTPRLVGVQQPYGYVRPMLFCAYQDQYEDCRYSESFQDRMNRRKQHRPLVLPQRGIRFPAGERPMYRPPPQHIESWAFLELPLPAQQVTAGNSDAGDWLMDDSDESEDQQDQGQTEADPMSQMDQDFERDSGQLLKFFRSPEGLPYAAAFLREILEDFTFLADDVTERLLVELKDLGKRPPGIVKWPRPSKNYWRKRLDKMSDFLFTSNEEPYFEQRQVSGKQYFVYELLALRELQQAESHRGINWQKCRSLVDERIEVTRLYVDATDMDRKRLAIRDYNEVNPLMQQILPSRARRDRKRAEKEAAGQGSSRDRAQPAVGVEWGTVQAHITDGTLEG